MNKLLGSTTEAVYLIQYKNLSFSGEVSGHNQLTRLAPKSANIQMKNMNFLEGKVDLAGCSPSQRPSPLIVIPGRKLIFQC